MLTLLFQTVGIPDLQALRQLDSYSFVANPQVYLVNLFMNRP